MQKAANGQLPYGHNLLLTYFTFVTGVDVKIGGALPVKGWVFGPFADPRQRLAWASAEQRLAKAAAGMLTVLEENCISSLWHCTSIPL